ncbi:helix-turn-helix domain-containing protein [Litoribrevibacter euphylliae]|uniref:Helix-turn-helix domain-containing protein n=1 Tax=Litoribrevibacter euphylliae TaxID=1834034 RepID=A0ABV7HEM3_9GAMM
MSRSSSLIKALKASLKASGLKYLDVANALDLSEASVKRLFAEENFSLKRLDQICELLGMEFSDLVDIARQSSQIRTLTIEQEKEIVNDISLLIVANSALNRWSFEDILSVYEFSETELIQYLAKLDRLKLIELLPGNRIKLLVDRNFSWQKNGPIQRFFEEKLVMEFFSHRFNDPGEKRQVLVGMLSRASNETFQRKLDKLAETFHSLHLQDEKLPVEERFGTSVITGMRLWEPKVFESKRRVKDERKF